MEEKKRISHLLPRRRQVVVLFEVEIAEGA
jgi:hypothetical protein